MHPLRTYLRLTICGACLSLGGLWGYANLPQLSADDPLEFDQKTRELKATGRATLVHDRFHMEADEIRFSQDKGVVIGDGDVKLSGSNFRAITDEVKYSTLDQRLEAKDYRLGSYPAYMSGSDFDSVHGIDKKEIKTRSARVYNGEPDLFIPNMWASRMRGWPGGIVKANHVVFKLGPIPVFYTPYAQLDTSESAVTVYSEYGKKNELGHYVRNNVYVKTSKHFKPGFLLDYYGRRGVLYGPALKYGGSAYKGDFQAGYIREREPARLSFIKDRRILRDRYFIEAQHIQDLDERINFVGHFSKRRDFLVTRDFRPALFAGNQQPDSFFETSYRDSNYIISVFTRVRANKFQLVEQRLPEVRFDYAPSPFFETPLYQSFFASYARIIERPASNDPSDISPSTLSTNVVSPTTADKWDAYYGLYLPLKVTDWMTFTPVVGARINHYQFVQTPASKLTRVTSEVGFDAEMRAYGQWDYKNKFWDIDGLRHVITPFVQYRNIQHSKHGDAVHENRDFSDKGFLLDPIELGNRRKLYPQADHHIVRVGLENKLQTRSKDYGARDLASLSVFQDAGFSRIDNQSHTLDLYAKGSISPAYWLAISSYGRFDPRDAKLQEIYSSTTVRDGDVWSASLSTIRTRSGTNQMGWTYNLMLTSRHFFQGDWRFNQKQRKLTEQKYAIKTKLGNNWWVTTDLIFRRGTNSQGSFEYHVSFDLVRY